MKISERKKKLQEEYRAQVSNPDNSEPTSDSETPTVQNGKKEHVCVYDIVRDHITLMCTVPGCSSRPIILLLNRQNVLLYFLKKNRLCGSAKGEAEKINGNNTVGREDIPEGTASKRLDTV